MLIPKWGYIVLGCCGMLAAIHSVNKYVINKKAWWQLDIDSELNSWFNLRKEEEIKKKPWWIKCWEKDRCFDEKFQKDNLTDSKEKEISLLAFHLSDEREVKMNPHERNIEIAHLEAYTKGWLKTYLEWWHSPSIKEYCRYVYGFKEEKLNNRSEVFEKCAPKGINKNDVIGLDNPTSGTWGEKLKSRLLKIISSKYYEDYDEKEELSDKIWTFKDTLYNSSFSGESRTYAQGEFFKKGLQKSSDKDLRDLCAYAYTKSSNDTTITESDLIKFCTLEGK